MSNVSSTTVKSLQDGGNLCFTCNRIKKFLQTPIFSVTTVLTVATTTVSGSTTAWVVGTTLRSLCFFYLRCVGKIFLAERARRSSRPGSRIGRDPALHYRYLCIASLFLNCPTEDRIP